MGDVEDPYLPMGSGLLVRLGEARDQLAALLNALPGMFAATAMPGGHCAAGAAAKGAVQLLNKCGGKVILFQTSLCTVRDFTGFVEHIPTHVAWLRASERAPRTGKVDSRARLSSSYLPFVRAVFLSHAEVTSFVMWFSRFRQCDGYERRWDWAR